MIENLLQPDEQKIDEALTFISEFSSVIIGSITNAGQPHTSYAPFVSDKNGFYVYVSGLAQHASALQNGKASLFFVEDERQAKTIFSRKRLSINCKVSVINRDTPRYDHLIDALQARHGSTVKLLRTLPDFILFELQPVQASFVTGFGAAYNLGDSLARLGKVAQ